jgi:signal transduction histidine kinase
VRDITGRKQVELELLEADRRKDEFLAMLAHELRNPLTPIRNAAHVLGRLELQEPRVQWAQQVIERQVGHLTRLVDDLLDVSRIVRGKVALKVARIEVAAVVNQALDMARPLIDAMGHQVAVRLPEQAVYLEGDPVRLAQVLLNLLDNAAKYTPAGGKIQLDVGIAGPVIEIKVCDNGMGIPAELLPQVFDLFKQGERTLDRSQGGLGIGLTLVKALVEMHGKEAVARALDDGLALKAFSAEYIAHMLSARRRIGTEPGALQLTRGADLLALELPEPDLSIYDRDLDQTPNHNPNHNPGADDAQKN